MDFLLLLIGLLALWLGSDLTIHAATSIARHLRLSEFIIGIAVLSIGSDLPELTIAVDAAIRKLDGADTSDVVIGSALGSSMGQIGLVLGVVGLFGTLFVPPRLILLHGGVMIASLPVLAVVGRDGSISRWEGALLLACYAAYFLLLLTNRRGDESESDTESAQPLYKALPFVAIGLATVIVGAELTVRSVTRVALDFQVDPAIVAIVIVGVGTSLPELSISLRAIVRNRVRMSIGNLIGSNIFDTLVPIGAASAIAGLDFDDNMLRFDLPFLVLLSLVALAFLLRRRGFRRLDALLLLALYIAYVAVRLGRA